LKRHTLVRRVDDRGRIVLPADWRREVLKGEEVFIVREGIALKIIPKRKPDLTEYFDSVDLGVEQILDWDEFERFVRGFS